MADRVPQINILEVMTVIDWLFLFTLGKQLFISIQDKNMFTNNKLNESVSCLCLKLTAPK